MHETVTIIAKYFIALSILGVLLVFAKLVPARRWNFIIHAVLSAVITAILVKIATSIHQDPRPFIRDGVVPYFKSSTDNGFPSDHTVFSAFCGFLVVFYSRKIGIGLLLLSILIGAARVIGGVHHTQDIVAGFLLAGIAVIIGFYAAKYFRAWAFKTRNATSKQS